MNLYLLSQDENTGYDTFDSCVVSAENEENAKKIHPRGHGCQGEWDDWASCIENVKCELIGLSNNEFSYVIISSFNAG